MTEPNSVFPSIISRRLNSLKRALRNYVIMDGGATCILGLLGLLAVDLALDRFFEFSQPFRAVLLIALFLLGFYVVWLRIIRRVWTSILDQQLAMVFERFIPGLNESLITAVELGKEPPEDVDPELYQQTVQQAAESLKSVRIGRFFRYGRLARRILTALLAIGCAFGLGFAFPETAKLWFSRNILLSQAEWPRRSEIIVDGFQNGQVRVGRGDSYIMSIRANTTKPLVPDAIQLRIGSRQSGYRTMVLDQFRLETVDGVDWRVFSYTFAEMLETLPCFVRGGDMTIDHLTIEVVPPPVFSEIKIRQKFPKYMKKDDRTVSPTGRTIVPDGTSVEIVATTNKPIRAASVSVDKKDSVPLPAESGTTPFETLTFSLPDLRQESVVEFSLEDIDGLKNRKPLRLEFGILKDTPPSVTARLDGIGTAVTPTAQLPTLGEVTDDNALASVRYRYFWDRIQKTDEKSNEKPEESGEPDKPEPPKDDQTAKLSDKPEEGTVEIPGVGESTTLYPISQEFSVSERSTVPGEKFGLQIEAMDRFHLDESAPIGQIGLGPRWNLEVVTPEKLKSLLEIREISLRQRFEVVIDEVDKTKAIIAEYSLVIPEELQKEVDSLTPPEKGKLSDAEFEKAKADWETQKTDRLNTVSKDQAATGKYNISRTVRNTQKEVYDIRNLVDSFRQIRLEMINNKIFSDEIEQRIDRGIISPMQELIEKDFVDVERLIDQLRQTLDDSAKPLRQTAMTQQTAILTQFDVILKKMTAIRDNMVSMESFNEAIELLRSILKQQQQLRNETQEEKTKRLKNLLD